MDLPILIAPVSSEVSLVEAHVDNWLPTVDSSYWQRQKAIAFETVSFSDPAMLEGCRFFFRREAYVDAEACKLITSVVDPKRTLGPIFLYCLSLNFGGHAVGSGLSLSTT